MGVKPEEETEAVYGPSQPPLSSGGSLRSTWSQLIAFSWIQV